MNRDVMGIEIEEVSHRSPGKNQLSQEQDQGNFEECWRGQVRYKVMYFF